MKLRRKMFSAACPLPAAVRAMTLSRWSRAASRSLTLYPPAEEFDRMVGCGP
jgi:hypothetical protein